jgi:hypothetical protein
VVAVDEADLHLLPPGERCGGDFEQYWRQVHADARSSLAHGAVPTLRPLINFDFDRYCREHGLSLRSQAGFDAYARLEVPHGEVFVFGGEPADMLLQAMVVERNAWAMMIRCQGAFRLAAEQFGDEAELEARRVARGLLDALLEGAQDNDEAVLVAKAGGGLLLGAYAVRVTAPTAMRPSLETRDSHRFVTLLAASLLMAATGTLVLRTPSSGSSRVRVWELDNQRLTPSNHGELLLEAVGGDRHPVEYVPGFALVSPR